MSTSGSIIVADRANRVRGGSINDSVRPARH
jgi:hypothetical protein